MEGLHDFSGMVVVAEESVVCANPHQVVDRVVLQGTDVNQQRCMMGINCQGNDSLVLFQVDEANTASPGANPELFTVVGSQRGHGIVG